MGWVGVSAISMKGDPNLEHMELVNDEQSETMEDREEEKQNEDVEGSGADDAAISILGGGVGIPPDTEMQVQTVNKVLRTRSSEGGS